MRLIDTDALKEQVCLDGDCTQCKTGVNEKLCKWNMVQLNDVMKCLEHAPTIDAVPHWIQYEERLPNEEGEYLVSMTWVTMPEFKEVMVLGYRPNAGFETINAYRADAWMPLPKPYEGERKDNG